MSDGMAAWQARENDRIYNDGVQKIAKKSPEEIYLILKDLMTDIQFLNCDDHITLTRSQFAALNRCYQGVKDLMK